MPLHQLGSETVRLLSSSQVITSVYAVVKELLENSLDAKATNIEVKLDNYGVDLIEVRDNGTGIEREDAPFMAMPHCTSKLVDVQDLASLESYGFRGEALNSIAAVSDLRITTCTEDDDVALVYSMDHSGQLIATRPSHLGRGTTVTVANLFRNVPVRKQYFRSTKRCKEDLKKVEGIMLALGIAHPRVRFVLKHNKNVIWQKLQTTDFKINVSLVLGASFMQQLSPITFQNFDPMLNVYGFVPSPQADVSQVSRATTERLFLLVNQRPVTVDPVIRLLKQMFVEAFPSQSGRFPMAVLCIDVPPSSLDVNLEPNKTTVLFHDMEFIMEKLSIVLATVYSQQPLEDISAGSPGPAPARMTSPSGSGGSHKNTEVQQRGGSLSEENTPSEMCHPPGTDQPERVHSPSKASPWKLNSSLGCSRVPLGMSGDEFTCAPLGDQQGLETDNNDTTRSLEGRKEDRLTDPPAAPSSTGGSLPLHPESYELLDIGDLEADMDDYVGPSSSGHQLTSMATTPSDRTTKQVTLSAWSRGEAIRDTAQQPVEPVKILQLSKGPTAASHSKVPTAASHSTAASHQKQSKLTLKRPSPVYDMINSKPVKRKASGDVMKGNDGCKKLKGSASPPSSLSKTLPSLLEKLREKEARVPVKPLPCALSEIAERLPTQSSEGPRLSDGVIGYCNPPGVWMVLLDRNIACFDAMRASQSFLNQKLMESGELLAEKRTDIEDLFTIMLNHREQFGTDVISYFHTICSLEEQ